MKSSEIQLACANVGQRAEDHFPDVRKMVEIGSGAQKALEDILLLLTDGRKLGRWEVLR